MDISIPVSGYRFNVRVAVLIDTPAGFIFEKDDKEGFYFPVGGRVKIGELSVEAAKREVFEELGIRLPALHQVKTSEYFFDYDGEAFHEICFFYHAELNHIELSDDFISIPQSRLEDYDLRPEEVKKLIVEKELICD